MPNKNNVPHHPEATHSDPVSLATFRLIQMKLKTRGDMNTIRCSVLTLGQCHTHRPYPLPSVSRVFLSDPRGSQHHPCCRTSSENLQMEPRCRATKLGGIYRFVPAASFPSLPRKVSWGHAFRPCRPHPSVSDDTIDSITDLGVS